MSQPHLIDSLERAHAEGRRDGADLGRSARDCPYTHAQFVLRGEWLKGFAEGRISVQNGARPARDGGR